MDRTTEGHHDAIPSTGLTVVVDPKKPTLDVVFVHGFTGHPVRTWTHKKGDQSHEESEILERPPKIQKLNPFSNSRQQKSMPTYWPQDLIPTILSNARVLTYGYDTHIRHKLGSPGSQNTVYDIAWDFLIALEAERRVEPSRPVLFIVHSLGGIVVKEMLRRSSDYYQSQTHLRNVFISTVGIMFFGTPHSGADPRSMLHRVAEKVAKAAGLSVNEQIVNSLLPSSERLKELRDEFGPRALQQQWIIHSFQEQHGVALLGGLKVVEDTSSCLNLATVETTEHIGRNHMEMCRFTGPNDVEFKKVASALRRMIGSLSTQVKGGDTLALSGEQRRSLLESLRFDQIDARWMTIKNAHTKTCMWLLKKTEYRDWLDAAKFNEHHGFLWIRGKPGTGKSILMKFLLANARKTMRDRIVISFFFNARGEGLEMSTLGTYQSLLLQLLERIPALQSVFDSLCLSIRDNSAKYQWTVETLKTLLEQVILSLGDSPLVCLIDALDECDERQIRDMTSFFEHIGELAVSADVRFQVCFSSRHYPNITIRKEIRLDLEGQEGHTQDIISYLESELRIGQSNMAEQVRIDVQEKASGIFLWVVLVVGILNKEYDSGRKHSLRRRVHDIPGDLHELFRDILTRDLLHREELVLCVQWVLFARQPLKPEQLYHAILSGVEPHDLSRWDSHDITTSDITRYIIDASKGLAEITASKTPTVQFIHQSVKDFFLKENGFNRIRPDLEDNFQGQSHEQLKRCCMSYLQFYMSSGNMQILGKDLPKASTQECKALRESVDCEFPFLEYAVHHVLYHADSAEGCNISQQDFIQNFRLRDWLWLDNLYEKHQVRRHTQNASLLYILAENNMSNLISIHPSNLSFLEMEDERYGFPLLASLATGSESAVRALIAALGAAQSSGSPLQELCNQYCREEEAKAKVGRDFQYSKSITALKSMAEIGHETLFSIALATVPTYHIQSANKYNQTALWLAAARGHGPIVEKLIEKEAEIDTRDFKGRTPLLQAAANGHAAIVKQLLENKAEIDTKNNEGETPLLLAATNGHEAVVKLLLENKVEIDFKNRLGHSPLWLAAAKGHEGIVKQLLENKAEINTKDSEGRSPLSQAVANGREAIVKLLLDNKAEVDPKDCQETPLWLAAAHGYENIVKLLLKSNAEINTKDLIKGRTPLWRAAANGEKVIVKLLLENNAEIDITDRYGRTPLSKAAEIGHEAVVRLLLENNAEIDVKDKYGLTPLWRAAANGEEVVVKLLLENNAEIDITDRYGRTPLSKAAEIGHEAVVRLLLENNAEIDVKDKYGLTPLWRAAANGGEVVVKLLLENNAEIDITDRYERTPLSKAAEIGHEAVVRLLLENNAEIDVKDKYGLTPLWRAAANGGEVVVKLLFENNAELDVQDTYGQTPLSKTAEIGHEAVVRLLLEKGAAVNPRSISGRTPLSYAASSGVLLVKLLLKTGKFDVDAKDRDGRTPLSHAASSGHECVVKLLLETSKVDVNSKDHDGRTPLSHAAFNGHGLVVGLLLDTCKINVDSRDNDGRTPLSIAAANHDLIYMSMVPVKTQEIIVKLLLETDKVDVDSKDKENKTPLWWAASHGSSNIVKLLLELGKADVNSKHNCDQTPLWIAAFGGHLATVNMLLETGKADVKSVDLNGQTPKDIAMEKGHKAVVELLENYYGQIRNQR